MEQNGPMDENATPQDSGTNERPVPADSVAAKEPVRETESNVEHTATIRKKRKSSVPMLLLAGAALFAAGYVGIRKAFPHMFADSATYDIFWHAPDSWVKKRPSPFTLFLYQHPTHDVSIRGFQYQCDSEINVSPELDSAGLADYYLDTTKENQPDWHGRKLEDVQAVGDLRFSIIERTKKGKIVITAFAAKGNTTVGAALYGADEDVEFAKQMLPEFRRLLENMYLKPAKGRAGGTELPALQ